MGHWMGLPERPQAFQAACGAARVGTLLRGLGSRLELEVHAAHLSCCGGERGSS
jgi:hypothetical protein